MSGGHTTVLGGWLERLEAGSPDARAAIIEHTCERLRLMARRTLRENPRVRRWVETDDVLQHALLRLHRSLAEVTPSNARQFYALAATQLRRELIDLARSHYGPLGIGTNTVQVDPATVVAAGDTSAPTGEPHTLEEWATFHEAIDRLPDDEREVVHLLWYGGVTQAEAANLLEISFATLKRRWRSARLTLADRVGEPPR